MSELEDQTQLLLRAWHQGDREALDQLVEQNIGWLHGYVRQRVGAELRQRMESIDLVQSVAIDVMQYGPKFELADRRQFRALLGKIVENNLRDKHRRLHAARRDIAREQVAAQDTVLDLDAQPGDTPTPSQAASSEEYREWVRLALELLDEQDRAVIELRRMDELSFEEIGEQLGMKADAARMRFQRALPKLARVIRDLQKGRLEDSLFGNPKDV